MEQVRDVLIQIALIILPLLLYEIIRLNRYYVTVPKPNRYATSALFSIIVILCLAYPINLGNTITYSFHDIAIITAFLYCGSFGIFPALVSILYTYVEHGSASFFSILVETVLVSIVPFYLSKKWDTYSKNKRIGSSFAFASLFALAYLIVRVLQLSILFGFVAPYIYFFFCTASIIMVVTMTLQVYVTEYVKENAMLRVEMQKAEKLNIISELAASVAHEVRNPLTVVRGFLQLLEGNETNKNKEYMQLVLAELDRAEQIISDYLNLARPQIEEKKAISLTSQLIEMNTLMSTFSMMKGVYLQVQIADNLYTIGDKAKLKQALINVVKNGIEAIQQNKGYLKIIAKKVEDQIVISVKDSGVGMTKEQLARLGQPYYSLKEKGTGLGLMVTFKIIQAHNGKIEYKSEIGKGTEVIITLPALQENK